MGTLKDLRQYLTRPIIPFCFGLPLLLPATLLVVVAFLQDDISTTLHVLGIFLLTLSVIAICCGIVLGCHDRWSYYKVTKRPTTKGFRRFGLPRKPGPKRLLKNCVSPTLTLSVASSTASSRSSSRRSSRSDSTPRQQVIVVNEMVRLVSNTPARKTRRLLNRQGVKTPKMPLQTLEEEDQAHASLSDSGIADSINSCNTSIENNPREGLSSGKSARGMSELEKHLREIGLGADVPGSVSQSPSDFQLLSKSLSRQKTDSHMELKKATQFGHTRSRSMPEEDFNAFLGQPSSPRGTGVAGSAREEELLRTSARARRGSHDKSPQPVVTNESCERAGVRMDIGVSFS